MIKFYSASMSAIEEGLGVFFKEFFSLRETECFHYCVREREHTWLANKSGIDAVKEAKERGYKVYRIAKAGSRIAQPSKELAFERLIFMKKRQIKHLERDLKVVSEFIDRVKDKQLSHLVNICERETLYVVPDSSTFVNNIYRFD